VDEPKAARPLIPAGYGVPADAYEEKYDYRVTPELGTVFAFRPRSAYTWREADFPRSASRWIFRSNAST
jgi:hypothetical protein